LVLSPHPAGWFPVRVDQPFVGWFLSQTALASAGAVAGSRPA
jgi:hypothetical protein